MHMKNQLAIKLIKSYQKNKQIIGVGHCKFYPTCSEYALKTYEKFNFFFASILVGIRILRCNPLARRRPYPVKLTKKEKEDIKFINLLKKDFDNDFIDYVLSINEIKDLNSNDFYNYLYDYYYLPKNPTSPVSIDDDLVFGTRYLISKNKSSSSITNKPTKTFKEYLHYVDMLYEQGLLKIKPVENEGNQNNLNLVPIDALSLLDILKDQTDKNIIVVNNYFCDLEIPGYTVIKLDNNKDFLKTVKDKKKLIVQTKDLDIFRFLPDIDYSINFFEKAEDINYFYNLNKKKF